MAKKKLDAAQKKAVEHIYGPFLCVAGPGSGKTTVIVNRVKHLVDSGINPNSILVVTFSRDAANEMNKRYQALKGAVPGPHFSTIHSFAYMVVRNAWGLNGNHIFTEDKQYRYVLDQIKNNKPQGLIKSMDTKILIQNIISELSAYRNTEYGDPFETQCFKEQEDFLQFFSRYTKYKNDNNLLDFDDMLFCCRDIFRDYPDHLKVYQDYYQFILVDEFQDTSAVQAEILYKLAEPRQNLFICGDDDQSIYRFRGARPDIMLAFPKQYPNYQESRLVTNYRSDRQIVEGAGNLISHNKVRFDKDICGKSSEEGYLEIIDLEQESMQKEKLIAMVREQVKETPLYEMAILARKNKEVSAIAKLFSDENIPFYCTVPITNIHDSFTFRTMSAYLELAYYQEGSSNKKEWDLIKELINKPYRMISKTALEGCDNATSLYYELKGQPLWNYKEFLQDIRTMRKCARTAKNVKEVMECILTLVDLDEYIKHTCEYLCLDYSEQNDIMRDALEEMKRFHSYLEYKDYIEIQDRVFQENMKRNKINQDRGVTISTLHRAKGLEYDVVFILSCNYGNIPSCSAKHPLTDAGEEEERRLLYVGVTRAKKKCYIFSLDEMEPSQYINEIIGEEDEGDCVSEYSETKEPEKETTNLETRKGLEEAHKEAVAS